jgi:hypothetical protein
VSDTQARLDAALREVDSQMSAKLEAQQALMVIVETLDLKLSALGNGWKEATPKILARIETIVDEAERGFSERDALEAELERVTAAAADYLKWSLLAGSYPGHEEYVEAEWVEIHGNLDSAQARLEDVLAGGARAAQENKMKGSG